MITSVFDFMYQNDKIKELEYRIDDLEELGFDTSKLKEELLILKNKQEARKVYNRGEHEDRRSR